MYEQGFRIWPIWRTIYIYDFLCPYSSRFFLLKLRTEASHQQIFFLHCTKMNCHGNFTFTFNLRKKTYLRWQQKLICKYSQSSFKQPKRKRQPQHSEPKLKVHLEMMEENLSLAVFSKTKNPSIYNLIHWFAGPIGQTNRRPSV